MDRKSWIVVILLVWSVGTGVFYYQFLGRVITRAEGLQAEITTLKDANAQLTDENVKLKAEVYPRSGIGPVSTHGPTKPPVRLRGVDPFYPSAAIEAGVTGVVVLEVTISETGKVTDAKVIKSVPLFDAAAIEAAKGWEYTPTKLNGHAVPVIIEVDVSFRTKK